MGQVRELAFQKHFVVFDASGDDPQRVIAVAACSETHNDFGVLHDLLLCFNPSAALS